MYLGAICGEINTHACTHKFLPDYVLYLFGMIDILDQEIIQIELTLMLHFNPKNPVLGISMTSLFFMSLKSYDQTLHKCWLLMCNGITPPLTTVCFLLKINQLSWLKNSCLQQSYDKLNVALVII